MGCFLCIVLLIVHTWSFLCVLQDASKGEVDTRLGNPLADGQAVVPEGVGRGVHEEQAAMSELHLHGFDLSTGLISPRVFVPEDEVSCRSKRDRGDGTEGVQLLFIITMLPHVILPILVPGGEERNTFSRETRQPESFTTNVSPVDKHKVKCLSGCFCYSIPDIFQSRRPRTS